MGSGESIMSSPSSGFRIINVFRGSPAHLGGLEMCFDSIVELDGRTLVSNKLSDFPELIASCENRAVKFVVFNSRFRAFRDVWITPRRWSTEHPKSLLGASVRHITNILEPVTSIRVLEVFSNSPASETGLHAKSDYLLGTDSVTFSTADDLLGAIAEYERSTDLGSGLKVYVYNSKTETSRNITLFPNTAWGGKGCLGCDIGEGLLHRIPPPTTAPRNYCYLRYIYDNDNGGEAFVEAESPVTAEHNIASLKSTPPTTVKHVYMSNSGSSNEKIKALDNGSMFSVPLVFAAADDVSNNIPERIPNESPQPVNVSHLPSSSSEHTSAFSQQHLSGTNDYFSTNNEINRKVTAPSSLTHSEPLYALNT